MTAPFILSESGAAQQVASQVALAGAGAMERGPHNPTRPQPVEKLHTALMRGRQGQPVQQPPDAQGEGSPNARHGLFKHRARGAAGVGSIAVATAPATRPFGPFAPFLAHLIAHEMGTFKGSYMPSELQSFYRYSPTDAYQAVIDRDSIVTVGSPPAQTAT